MSCAKMAESIDLLFGLWTQVSQRKHKFNPICQMVPMCPHWPHVLLGSICVASIVRKCDL